MSNLLFPKVRGLGWTITKNPTFSTEIQSSLAGREVRVQNFQNPIWEFTLAYEYLLNDPRSRDENEQTPLETLVGFFLARGGQFDDFLLNESDLTQRLEDSVYSRAAHRHWGWSHQEFPACAQRWRFSGSLPKSGEPAATVYDERRKEGPGHGLHHVSWAGDVQCCSSQRRTPSRRTLLFCTACGLTPERREAVLPAERAKELNSATSISISMNARKCS